MYNSNNKRRKNKRKYQSISQNEEQYLIKNGISKSRFYERVTRGWSREKAMTKPVNQHIRITEEEKRLMKENGVDNKTFRARISRNMDRKEAATKPKRKYNYKDK
ncbi:hypothetical protein [Staphylococcus caledonicus]|uniref:hypothetical protein n=1 Tax=Staphylococcus caledonicus TaxID=2741333 RepID=UPI0018E497D4|nr:hypothetical protein [Staphylococcus caledonicus]MBI5973921.1 hypothetical protein [Staphylococcus caledonicus]